MSGPARTTSTLSFHTPFHTVLQASITYSYRQPLSSNLTGQTVTSLFRTRPLRLTASCGRRAEWQKPRYLPYLREIRTRHWPSYHTRWLSKRPSHRLGMPFGSAECTRNPTEGVGTASFAESRYVLSGRQRSLNRRASIVPNEPANFSVTKPSQAVRDV